MIPKIQCESLRETTLVFMGSEEDVKMVEAFMAREEAAETK